ncbi:MAG: hypothetical protein ACM31L_12515 [Actinomycetota bacterium]
MANFDDQSKKRLAEQLTAAFDDENAGDMEAFTRNFLHNGTLLDQIGDQYPAASMSAVRTLMLQAYGEWVRTRENG